MKENIAAIQQNQAYDAKRTSPAEQRCPVFPKLVLFCNYTDTDKVILTKMRGKT